MAIGTKSGKPAVKKTDGPHYEAEPDLAVIAMKFSDFTPMHGLVTFTWAVKLF